MPGTTTLLVPAITLAIVIGLSAAEPIPVAPSLRAVEGGTRVTFEASDEPAQAAFERFGRAAGVEFEAASEVWAARRSARVTARFDGVTYWETMATLCAQTRLMPEGSGGRRVRLADDLRNWPARPSMVVGAFRVDAAYGWARERVVLRREEKVTSEHELSLAVFAEPGVPALYIGDPTFEPALGDKGEPVKLGPARSDGRAFVRGHASVRIPFDPPTGLRRLRQLSVALPIVLETGSDALAVDLDDKGAAGKVARDAGGTALTITVRPTPPTYTVEVSAVSSNTDAKAWAELRPALDASRPRLSDAAGRAYQLVYSHSEQAGPAALKLSYSFHAEPNPAGQPGTPRKLVWDVPLRVEAVTVRATLTDVPLP